jgi:hypothetical protein
MMSAIIEVIYKSYSLFFLYAHLCASLSRFRIGLPVCDNVFKQLKCYPPLIISSNSLLSPSLASLIESYIASKSPSACPEPSL